MSRNTKLQDAVRLALGLGAGTLALGFSPGALAQDEGAEQVEEITRASKRKTLRPTHRLLRSASSRSN